MLASVLRIKCQPDGAVMTVPDELMAIWATNTSPNWAPAGTARFRLVAPAPLVPVRRDRSEMVDAALATDRGAGTINAEATNRQATTLSKLSNRDFLFICGLHTVKDRPTNAKGMNMVKYTYYTTFSHRSHARRSMSGEPNKKDFGSPAPRRNTIRL